MAQCTCEILPSTVDLEKEHSSWSREFVQIAEKPFLTLQECRLCGQLWQFDQIDKLQTSIAIKVGPSADWESFSDEPFRKEHLARSRGGLSAEMCVLKGCTNRALRTLAYCLDHAYEYAGLRE